MKKKIGLLMLLFGLLGILVLGSLNSFAANGRWISDSVMDWDTCSQVGTRNHSRRTTFNFSISRSSNFVTIGSAGRWLSPGASFTLTAWAAPGNKWGMVNTTSTNHSAWFGA